MTFKPVKISKLVNPFSQMYSDSESNNDSLTSSKFRQGLKAQNHMQPTFPNIFQYNERQKILISDSSYQDSSYDNYDHKHFQKHNQNQYHQNYNSKNKQFMVSSGNGFQISKQNQKQNQSLIQKNNKTIKQNQKNMEKFQSKIQSIHHQRNSSEFSGEKPFSTLESTKGQNLTSSSKQQVQFSLQVPQINKFVLTSNNENHLQNKKVQAQTHKQSKTKHSQGNQQKLKTIQPSSSAVSSFSTKKSKFLHPQYTYTYKLYSNSNEKITQKHNSNTKRQQQQILNQDIDIFGLPQNSNDEMFQKDCIMQKLQLSKGSQIHSITENILQNLNGQQHQQEQVQIEQSKSPSVYNEAQQVKSKELTEPNNSSHHKLQNKKIQYKKKQTQFIFQSKLIQGTYDEKIGGIVEKGETQKRKRKKIFDQKSNLNNKSAHAPYNSSYLKREDIQVSSFTQKDLHYRCPHTQCLLKSLNIIQKMVPQKQSHNMKLKESTSQKSQRSIINHSHMTARQKQKQQFLQISQRIIQINFQMKSIESVFGIDSFESANMIAKMNWLQQASIELFRYIKTNKITSEKIVNEIMMIYQKIQKMVRCYEKYSQIKQKLLKIQRQIKDILMLDIPQKYKKTKMIWEMINILDQSEWSLSQQSAKDYSQVSQCLRNYIKKQKALLCQLIQWIKQSINKSKK